jgi:hypothetical protein
MQIIYPKKALCKEIFEEEMPYRPTVAGRCAGRWLPNVSPRFTLG